MRASLSISFSLRARGDGHHAHLLVRFYKGALRPSEFRLAHFTFITRNYAGFSRRRSSLSASVLVSVHVFWLGSRLCRASVSSPLLIRSRLCLLFCSRLRLSRCYVSASRPSRATTTLTYEKNVRVYRGMYLVMRGRLLIYLLI